MKVPLLVVTLLALAVLAVGCGLAPDPAPTATPVAATEQPIKVLLVGSKPTWSYRYFGNAWTRARGVQLLRHLSDVNRSPYLENVLAALPVSRAGWQKHDVVVLCEWDAHVASAACVSSLAEFVAGGGGLITIAEGGAVSGYCDDRWQAMLPVRLASMSGAGVPTKTALAVSGGAEGHGALQFCDEHAVEKVLPTLPPVYFRPSVESLAQDAKTLVVAEAIKETPANTVMAIRPVGSGQSLWIGTGDLWRWRDPHAELYMDAFAASAVRAVARR